MVSRQPQLRTIDPHRGMIYLEPHPGSSPGTLQVESDVQPEITLIDYNAIDYLRTELIRNSWSC